MRVLIILAIEGAVRQHGILRRGREALLQGFVDFFAVDRHRQCAPEADIAQQLSPPVIFGIQIGKQG